MVSLARAELARHDWDSIECGCGLPSRHLLDTLESIIDGNASGAIGSLENHVFVQSVLMSPAPAVCAVVMALMVDGMAPDQVRDVLRLILGFAAGEEDGDTLESSLYLQCAAVIRDGLLLVYREFLAARSPEVKGYADDILEIIEEDSARLEFYRRL